MACPASLSGRKPHPLAARIKRLMQADEAVGKIAQGTPLAISKAVELMLLEISYGGIRVAQREGVRTVGARHLAQVPLSAPEFGFLHCLQNQFVGVSSEGLQPEISKRQKRKKQEIDDEDVIGVNGEKSVKHQNNKKSRQNGVKQNQTGIRPKKVPRRKNVAKENNDEQNWNNQNSFSNAVILDQDNRQDDRGYQSLFKAIDNGVPKTNQQTRFSKQQQQSSQNEFQLLKQDQQKTSAQELLQFQMYQPQQFQQQQLAPCFDQLQGVGGLSLPVVSQGGLFDDEDDYDNL
eukprot:TRINITY_DN35258_c0_g1_i1.p1 TRINITY_DN35258_c0_g1~~TRINITY_DN35258_c0_g1_i1.p1  ORF type:complete len:290 (+),score=42.06 TRINITY_DN35258_c0_g1_i1:118-987(+)